MGPGPASLHSSEPRPTKETPLGIIGWIIVGVAVGAVATTLQSNDEAGGAIAAVSVTVVGAVLGGLIASAFGIGAVGSFVHLGAWAIAAAGAALLLAFYTGIMRDDAQTAQG